MSRSYLKTPIMGICGGSSAQKKFKRQEHSRERAFVRDKLNAGQFELLYSDKLFGNEWDSPRDGKSWFGNCKYRKPTPRINWPVEYKKWMRK